MLFRKIYLILFAGLLVFSMSGCFDSKEDKDVPSQAEAQAISANVMAAVSQAMSDVQASNSVKALNKGIVQKAIVSVVIAESGPYWTATGTYSYDNINYYPAYFDVTFSWIGFTYNNVTLSSGTARLVFDEPLSTSWTYDYTGDFDVSYQGITYDFSWNISMTYNEPNFTYSGTYTINGATFTYSGSGK